LRVGATRGLGVRRVPVGGVRPGTAETCDVIVTPSDDHAYTISAQSLDRTGYARGTLAPRIGMQAEIPALDARPLLTMMDMGMAHGAHASHASAPVSNEHAGHDAHASVPPVRAVTHAHPVGPTVDMTVQQVSTRLDDPGIGLRRNGRRVLT